MTLTYFMYDLDLLTNKSDGIISWKTVNQTDISQTHKIEYRYEHSFSFLYEIRFEQLFVPVQFRFASTISLSSFPPSQVITAF